VFHKPADNIDPLVARLAGFAQIPDSWDDRNASTQNHDFIGAGNPPV
jgi:hypothetical protein